MAITADLEKARIVTDDIARFWAAYDAATQGDPVRAFTEMYFAPATDGLRDFIRKRIGDAAALAQSVRERRPYFDAVRGRIGEPAAQRQAILAAMHALRNLYDGALFSDIYLLIGRFNCGGTTSSNGMLIGAEMFGRGLAPGVDGVSPLTPDELPPLVAHELIHINQAWDRVMHGPNPPRETLLAMTVVEGAADFVGELISGSQVNGPLHAYGMARESALWDEFRAEMHGTEFGYWYGDLEHADGRPRGLSYFIGYRIVEAYYRRAQDKRRAVRDILECVDFERFLQASGYMDSQGR